MIKFLDTKYVRFELEDDLLTGHYKKDLRINLEIAEAVVKARLEFTEYKPVLALAINEGVVSMNKEARDFLASDEGVKCVIAGAVVNANNPVAVFFVNFYLAVARPKVPARMFTTKEAAIKWLKKFRKAEVVENS